MVEDRVDAVLLVDVLDPSGRDAEVLADDVDPHLLQEAHLVIERFDDDVVGLAPEVVGVVLADGHVAPVHAEHHRGLAVDEKERSRLRLCRHARRWDRPSPPARLRTRAPARAVVRRQAEAPGPGAAQGRLAQALGRAVEARPPEASESPKEPEHGLPLRTAARSRGTAT